MKYLHYFTAVALFLVLGYATVSLSTGADRQLTEAAAALSADIAAPEAGVFDYEDIEDQLATLRRQLAQPDILQQDIVRGWYEADFDEKKYGTPVSWVFVEDDDHSIWISPRALEDMELQNAAEICAKTAGHFILSCLDTAKENCEYVPESSCSCLPGSRWHEEQGCIRVNAGNGFEAISSDELSKGWYSGAQSEKKLNTPESWTWSVQGKNAVWQKSE